MSVRFALPRLLVLALTFTATSSLTPLPAAPQPASIFSDHMVLQREQPVPVWGTADPGEPISVTFSSQTQRTLTGTNGHWQVILSPLAVNRDPQSLTITGAVSTESVTFSDVLIGEVWFCSGQSNMEKPLGKRKGQKPTDNYALALATARHPQLRLFQVPRSDQKRENPAQRRWLACTPEVLAASEFSAAAYAFGADLQAALDVPVGLVHSSFGGTRIEAWMPPAAFTRDPALAGLDQQTYQAWVPGVQPTELFQSMIAPYVPFAVKGFLWYQGETNLMNADTTIYTAEFRALIATWRDLWHLPTAPFHFALLAPFDYSRWDSFPKKLTPEALPAFWESQIAATAEPNTDFIVISDLVANLHDIHPTNKTDVGHRFARLALVNTYHRPDLTAHGPRFTQVTPTTDGKLALIFDHAEGLFRPDGQPLSDFIIAGEDRIFHPATATIVENQVIVSSPEVPAPVAVRFGWFETATPNLFNAAQLPAAPFRTDDWPITVELPKPPAPATAADSGKN